MRGRRRRRSARGTALLPLAVLLQHAGAVDECATHRTTCQNSAQRCIDPDETVTGDWYCQCVGSGAGTQVGGVATCTWLGDCTDQSNRDLIQLVCASAAFSCDDPDAVTSPNNNNDWLCICIPPNYGSTVVPTSSWGSQPTCQVDECMQAANWNTCRNAAQSCTDAGTSSSGDWGCRCVDSTGTATGAPNPGAAQTGCTFGNACDTGTNAATCTDKGQLCYSAAGSATFSCRCLPPYTGADVTGAPALCGINECAAQCPSCADYGQGNNYCTAHGWTCVDPSYYTLYDWYCEYDECTMGGNDATCQGNNYCTAHGWTCVDPSYYTLYDWYCEYDECTMGGNDATCQGAGQTCTDPNKRRTSLADWKCVCTLPQTGEQVGAVATCSLDECNDAANKATCSAAGQNCEDPGTGTAATGDWKCKCADGSAEATAAAASCPVAGQCTAANRKTCTDGGQGCQDAGATFNCVCIAPATGSAGSGALGACALDECTVQCPSCAAKPDGLGSSCTNKGYNCSDPNTGSTSTGDWFCTVDECSVPPTGSSWSSAYALCASEVLTQACVDPNTNENSLSDWQCVCQDPYSGSQTGGAAACVRDECTQAANNGTCTAAGQTCRDPDTGITAQNDWLCECVAPLVGNATTAAPATCVPPPPSSSPSVSPSVSPVPPTAAPSAPPSSPPTQQPTQPPVVPPTAAPSLPPSSAPSDAPSLPPTDNPIQAPTVAPSNPPQAPSVPPTAAPQAPSVPPSQNPSGSPMPPPTNAPLPPGAPTASPVEPTLSPTAAPSVPPVGPSAAPSGSPTTSPYQASTPSVSPAGPTAAPSGTPVTPPSGSPIVPGTPTAPPVGPSAAPSLPPSAPPTAPGPPTAAPSSAPSAPPVVPPTKSPLPAGSPTQSPVPPPTSPPTVSPSLPPLPPGAPTRSPVVPPSAAPSRGPSAAPVGTPTTAPTMSPYPPGQPSAAPAASPSAGPTPGPSAAPYGPGQPSVSPVLPPSAAPSAPRPPSVSPTISPYKPGSPTASPVLPPTQAPRSPSMPPSLSPYTPGTPTAAPVVPPTAAPSTPPSARPSLSPYKPGDPTKSPAAPSAAPYTPGSPTAQPATAPPSAAPYSASTPSSSPLKPTVSPYAQGSPSAAPQNATEAPSFPPPPPPPQAYDECVGSASLPDMTNLRLCASAAQTCVDPNPVMDKLGDWECRCLGSLNGTAPQRAAFCTPTEDCASNSEEGLKTCQTAGQYCEDPTGSAVQGDWQCMCPPPKVGTPGIGEPANCTTPNLDECLANWNTCTSVGQRCKDEFLAYEDTWGCYCQGDAQGNPAPMARANCTFTGACGNSSSNVPGAPINAETCTNAGQTCANKGAQANSFTCQCVAPWSGMEQEGAPANCSLPPPPPSPPSPPPPPPLPPPPPPCGLDTKSDCESDGRCSWDTDRCRVQYCKEWVLESKCATDPICEWDVGRGWCRRTYCGRYGNQKDCETESNGACGWDLNAGQPLPLQVDERKPYADAPAYCKLKSTIDDNSILLQSLIALAVLGCCALFCVAYFAYRMQNKIDTQGALRRQELQIQEKLLDPQKEMQDLQDLHKQADGLSAALTAPPPFAASLEKQRGIGSDAYRKVETVSPGCEWMISGAVAAALLAAVAALLAEEEEESEEESAEVMLLKAQVTQLQRRLDEQKVQADIQKLMIQKERDRRKIEQEMDLDERWVQERQRQIDHDRKAHLLQYGVQTREAARKERNRKREQQLLGELERAHAQLGQQSKRQVDIARRHDDLRDIASAGGERPFVEGDGTGDIRPPVDVDAVISALNDPEAPIGGLEGSKQSLLPAAAAAAPAEAMKSARSTGRGRLSRRASGGPLPAVARVTVRRGSAGPASVTPRSRSMHMLSPPGVTVLDVHSDGGSEAGTPSHAAPSDDGRSARGRRGPRQVPDYRKHYEGVVQQMVRDSVAGQEARRRFGIGSDRPLDPSSASPEGLAAPPAAPAPAPAPAQPDDPWKQVLTDVINSGPERGHVPPLPSHRRGAGRGLV
eukprot:TRINITY_DN1959_c4_g3_i1.p1 TRINITY_DN1959_c4_g3~~TRINITY_DN1959_c4_g3_i1.p1  ORF type:complete len:2005 (+),score=462.78 TRINITY_DN1959_c4_g3_i1:73-6087(+)